MISRQFAQSTSVPNNGASNAQDFQPLTQNPQSVGGNLQQSGSTGQNTSTQDILSNQNARIVVPSEPADAPPFPANSAQMPTAYWPLGILLVAVLSVVAAIFLHRRLKKPDIKSEVPAGPNSEALANTKTQVIDVPKLTIPVNKPIPKPATQKPRPKKSKSKRKKSRK